METGQKQENMAKALTVIFNLVNITSFWKTKVCGGIPLELYADYIKNISPSNDTSDYAYALGFSLGKVKEKGDWAFSYKYGRIEPDAVVGLFADANFGGSNRRGNMVSLKYQFHKCMQFGATVWNTDSVRGHQDETTDIALDLIYKF